MSASLHIAVVAGEESGDLLAADLVAALKRSTGRQIVLTGVGGEHLRAHGLKSLFNPSEIALMGISAVVRRLPGLVARIRRTAAAVVSADPDILLIVDSPDFTHRVARRVRAARPGIPVVNYVCPSVWAWRPGRAQKMRGYVDHVLCLLPFEPAELERLGGPAATYVGHRLSNSTALRRAADAQRGRGLNLSNKLLLLPGSRRGEVAGLLDIMGETVNRLRQIGFDPLVEIPAVPHLRSMIEDMTANWRNRPAISIGEEARYAAFRDADAALAASGTVTLELALAGVPTVSVYKTDFMARFLRKFIISWSASLPNLIADRPVVPEIYDEMLRPNYVARHLAGLLENGAARRAQIEGFSRVREIMATEKPAGELAAAVVLGLIGKKKGG